MLRPSTTRASGPMEVAIMNGQETGAITETSGRLWLRWVGATAAGVALAFAAFLALFSVIGDPGALFAVIMIAFGAVIGAFQQWVLRRRLGDARRWALATAVGLGTGLALAVAMGLGESPGLAAQIAQGALAGGVAGTVIGATQWLVLRSRIAASGWWVAASIAGWAAGAAAGDGVAYVVDGLDLVVAPLVAASVTGIALVWLLQAREQPAHATG
jgi:hypothetical protein